jgi:NAD(P) transhydrogenase
MLAALGVRVTLVDRLTRPLSHIDDELAAELTYHLRGSGVSLQFGRAVTGVTCTSAGPRVRLDDGAEELTEAVLVAVGRRPDFGALALPAGGLDADQLLHGDGGVRTPQPHVFVAGDAFGAAGTTPAAVEQGRHAALAALGRRLPPAEAMPVALYTTPELSYVGSTEQELRAASTPYVAGVGTYRDLLRGEVAGDSFGRLKLLVHSDSRAILGVHILGRAAAELVHIGQTAMAGDLRLEFFSQATFNYPTFTTAYTDAALDAGIKLRQRLDR